eukprot:1157180-Pelagomonas_calceolata.AAC.7
MSSKGVDLPPQNIQSRESLPATVPNIDGDLGIRIAKDLFQKLLMDNSHGQLTILISSKLVGGSSIAALSTPRSRFELQDCGHTPLQIYGFLLLHTRSAMLGRQCGFKTLNKVLRADVDLCPCVSGIMASRVAFLFVFDPPSGMLCWASDFLAAGSGLDECIACTCCKAQAAGIGSNQRGPVSLGELGPPC